MQRYRINYHLLIGLAVGSVVLAIALYFLHNWQLNRKATWYHDRAQAALEQENKLEAFEYLEKFVKIRTEDDKARVELAGIAADILDMEGVEREKQALAFGILDQTVRRTGDPAARRKIADLMFNSGRPQDAITHYEELLKLDPDNGELKALQCRAMFRANDFVKGTAKAFELIGYDDDAETFDETKGSAPNQPEIYSTLASVLIQRDNDLELASKVVDQMVKANPESAVAHLERSVFLYGQDKKEEAAAELEEASKLDPNSSNVLYRRAAVASDEEQYGTTVELSKEGIERYPGEMRFYRMLASAELSQKEYAKAVAALDQAIEKFPKERSIEFLILKIDMLLAQSDIEGAKQVIAEIENLGIQRLKPLIDFQYARLAFAQGKWAQASQKLQHVRPQLVGFGRMQALAGTMLAEVYSRLGKRDLAIQMYDLVAADDSIPSEDPAKKLAVAKVAQLRAEMGIVGAAPAEDLNSLVKAMLAKPESEQDWTKIDALVLELVEKRKLSEAQKALLQAQVFMLRGKFTEAREYIKKAAQLDPKDINVRYAAIKLLLQEPPPSPQRAWELLGKMEQELGVVFDVRALMVEAAATIGGDEVRDQLRSLTKGTEEWTDDQKMPLLANIGLKFLQLGDLEESARFLSQAADLAPNNLPIRIQLFDIAFQQRDDEAMRAAQKRILELVSTDDGNYIVTEVKRRLAAAGGEQLDKESLREARAMLDAALKRRSEWHELHVLYGQLLLVLGEDIDIALQHLNDALKYGPPNANAVGLQVKLLAQRGDLKQAREKMNFIPEQLRGRVLDRTEAAVLAAAGETDAAFEAAKEEAARKPEDAATQAWFGSLAAQLNKLDDAAIAYRKACDLNPLEHDHWMKLVSVYAQQQDSEAIENAFRDAQLALDPEFLPLIQAKFFELQGRWTGAEDIYRSMYQDRLNEAAVAQRMAAFYMLWAIAEPQAAEKAIPYLNAILRAGNEGKLPPDDPTVDWARDKAARYLVSKRNYRDSLKAERLLAQSSPDGKVSPKFQTLYTQILSSRADPVSILGAIENLSAMNRRGQLSKEDALLLAKLYARTNQWKLGKAVMLDALSLYPADPEVWATYINLLIGQKEYTQAAQRLGRFAELSNNKFQVFQLRAHLAHQRGDEAEVKRLLRSMLPKDLGPASPLTNEQLEMVKAIAGLSVSFGDYKLSEQLLKLYVQRKNEGIGDLMNVLALHGSADEALPIMKQMVSSAPVPVSQLAVQMLRQRRPELGDKYDDQVMELMATALRDDPESVERLVTRAEMFEVMEKYDEAIKAYEGVLNRGDLQPASNAAVMNNLAFLLAQTNQRLDDAEKFIDEAIEILGPVADALDTRAVIRMARKEYPLAVEDMELALAVDPSAVKYYHLAKAQALAGNADGALEAWQHAQEMGISRESLPLIEQPGFAETEKLIESLNAVESN